MVNKELKNIIVAIRLAAKSGCTTITLPIKHYNYFFVLQILLDKGFIANFEKRGKFMTVGLKQVYSNSFMHESVNSFSSFDMLPRESKKNTFSSKKISKIEKLQSSFQLNLFSTDQGIQTGQELLKKRIGGMPLFRIK